MEDQIEESNADPELTNPEIMVSKDVRSLLIRHSLHIGDMEPLINEIENGGLAQIAEEMDERDNERLVRALRTGSPLSKAERRTTRRAEKERERFLLCRICYWHARGKPIFAHENVHTATQLACDDYSTAPLSGAPTLSPEHVHKRIWKPFAAAQREPIEWLDDLVSAFAAGLKDSADQNSTTEKTKWFRENVLKTNSVAVVRNPTREALKEILGPDQSDDEVNLLKNISGVRKHRTYLDKNGNPVDTKQIY